MPRQYYSAFIVHMDDGSAYRTPHYPAALETAEARGGKIIEQIQVSRAQETGYAYRETAAARWINWPIYKISKG